MPLSCLCSLSAPHEDPGEELREFCSYNCLRLQGKPYQKSNCDACNKDVTSCEVKILANIHSMYCKWCGAVKRCGKEGMSFVITPRYYDGW